MLPAFVALLLPQQPAVPPAPRESITVALAPVTGNRCGLSLNASGPEVPLQRSADGLTGSFVLGPPDAPRIAVRLRQGGNNDEFLVDRNRDGVFGDDEAMLVVPQERNGMRCTGFTTVLTIPVPAGGGRPAAERPYWLYCTFVEDPNAPAARPVLCVHRRGWQEGTCRLPGVSVTVHVVVTEMSVDGMFDQRDYWSLCTFAETAPLVPMERHAWFGGKAYRPVSIDPHGRSITFEQIDPGLTEAEQRAGKDLRAADREAARGRPLAFGRDLDAALAAARRRGLRVLVYVQTAWCEPCREMEQLVFTADDVVSAADNVIAVRVDGERPGGPLPQDAARVYPLLLLLDGDGNELGRAVGYQGVAAVAQFLQR